MGVLQEFLVKLNSFGEKLLKTFLFFWILLCLYRIIFIAGMSEYISANSDFAVIITAIISGAKLSMQGAGGISLFMLIGFIAEAIWHRLKYFRFICSFAVIFITTLLFVARFPFYKQFHSGFNQMIFMAVHEDMYALFMSMVDQYQLPLKLTLVLLLSLALNYGFCKWIERKIPIIKFDECKYQVKAAIILVVVYAVGTLSFNGGGWSWRTGANWENSGITKDAFLNEAILDDYQAIYRAYANKRRMDASNDINYSAEEVRDSAKYLTGVNGGDDLSLFLAKKAPGATIAKPKHVVLVLSESYANWPLLEKYSDLHIADGMKKIIAEDDTAYNNHFLPSGPSTVGAVMTMTTGLANVLYLTTEADKIKQPFLTAFAPQMKKLGYETTFWYSGPATWENIQTFTLSQGFDHFYSKGDIDPSATGSVWGVDDEYLYRAVLDDLAKNQDKSTFTIVLNTSNHSPFNVDVKAKGFDEEKVRQALPKEYRDNDELLTQLGHFWYADHYASDFINQIKAKYPDSLIIFMGDHGDRYNIQTNPTMYERYVIPFIVTGSGVTKDMLPANSAGSQIDVMPTVLDMIAPKDFTYYSIGKPFKQSTMGENYNFWITNDAIGTSDNLTKNAQYFNQEILPDEKNLQEYIKAVRSVSWWLGKNGTIIEDPQLQ